LRDSFFFFFLVGGGFSEYSIWILHAVVDKGVDESVARKQP
jgi:hypothetical protein